MSSARGPATAAGDAAQHDRTLQDGVVVGVSGSAPSTAALRFAAAEAALRGLPLTVVHTWEVPTLYEGAVVVPWDDVERAEAGVLQDAVDQVHQLDPDLRTTGRLLRGRPDQVLVPLSERAAMVVLGTHAGTSAWLGPVLAHVPSRSVSPVVVVPEGSGLPQLGRDPVDVVVGVDATEVSARAVGHAFEQAARWQGRLVAVLALETGFDAYLPEPGLLRELADRGRRQLSEALSGWCTIYPEVVVEQEVTLEHPLLALREAAAGAGLVVVGSHGRGLVGRVALGSVSASLLRSAPCPVAVVRPHDPARGRSAERHQLAGAR